MTLTSKVLYRAFKTVFLRFLSKRLWLLSRIRSFLTLEASKKRYTLHSCSHYLTMLIMHSGKSEKGVERATATTEPRSSNYITEELSVCLTC